MLNFLETLFICNNIDKNLNKNFHTYLSYHSVELLFLFFYICAISSSKKFEKKLPKPSPSTNMRFSTVVEKIDFESLEFLGTGHMEPVEKNSQPATGSGSSVVIVGS